VVDGQYQIVIVPTTKEATRIEKVDYEAPFPRLVPKANEKTKPIIAPKVTFTDDKDDDEGDDEKDELDDEFEDEEDED